MENCFQKSGLGLVYRQNNEDIIKHIDLTNLNEITDISDLTNKILENEKLNTQHHKITIQNAILKIQLKLTEKNKYKDCQTAIQHFLPITNVAVDNTGKKCVTGSYDHTARIWDLENGQNLHSLEGHKNVVFSVTYNQKYDKILTGSFDKTAKLWDSETGDQLQTFWGHTDELITAQFLSDDKKAVTASTDASLRIFEIETAQEIGTCLGHGSDIVCVQIDKNNKFIATGSFDKTIRIWDVRDASCVHVLLGHEGEISSCKMNDEGTTLISGSFDGRIIVWDLRKMRYFKIFPTTVLETEKILDVDFKPPLIAGSTSEGNAYIFNLNSDTPIQLEGHSKAIPKISFNPTQNNEVLSCSLDHTVRIWNLRELQVQSLVLEHPDEVFSAVYSNCGRRIVSACKDNTCRMWKK